ncbi:putative uncharacterized protein DDB_G0282133 [Maniola hyperantus]|uniref:putative uncharacterized protein DDB_G0282133 n=1 Tax=Aphantopus hyperantus TaxID=2795564 RepID=UPI00374802CE
MDSNLDITICEEDFNISDDFTQCDDQMMNDDDQMLNDDHNMIGDELNKSHDSVNILNNFALADLNDPSKENDDLESLLEFMTEMTNFEGNSEILKNTPQINFSQLTNFEETQMPVNIISTQTKEIADNIGIACNTYVVNDHKAGNDNNTAKVINNTNHIINNNNTISNDTYHNATDLNKNLNNETYCESTNLTDRNNENGNNNNLYAHILFRDNTNEMNIRNNNIDSQQTVLYTLQGFTNNTHVSQSQDENLVMANKNLIHKFKITYDNSSNQNVNENTQNKKDEVIDTNLDPNVNDESKNIYSEQDFQNFYANNIERLNQNTNTTNNMNNNENFDVNNINILDKVTIFGDKDGQRKHKNVENDTHNDSKRFKNDANENVSQKLPEFSQNFDITNSSGVHLDKNADDELQIHSQNNNIIDFDKTGNRNTEPVNTRKQYSYQDFAFLDSYSNAPDIISQNKRDNERDDPIDFAGNASQNLFSPLESQSLHLSNIYGNISRESILNVIENTRSNTISNTTAKEIIEKSNNEDVNKENSINLEKPKEIVSENKIKESVSNTNNEIEFEISLKHLPNTDDETLKLISYLKENLQLKQCVMNNVPNETKEVISHQEKMKECILNNNKEMDIVTQNDLSDNETDTQLEIVPFKVLDGLNRIKCYLNRSDRKLSEGNNNSMDSGFKSSQARSSYMSASQCSDAWKDEWAQCLLSFVTGSQLSANTTVITDEISAILGKMVDKLHEEEKYPIFLEELLENVNTLLNDVYKGNNEESNLLKREDDIYRLLLLNRSTHIIKYTIEKIITILEKTISDIKEDVFELKHTNEAENICYIFHILEILLKRYKKSNESSQMSIQNTQDDDKVLKKSSLTEIWRKKWNLTKSEAIEGSAKKTCVLTKCSEVLNKMIVQAMDGYSLVSFAALQCFNLLQN